MKWINRLSRQLTAHPEPLYNNYYEQAACHYLLNQGLILQTTNYRCRLGEIDLIMQHNNSLVFVEVRYRKSPCYGSAIDSITAAKQKKIIKAAQHYLQHCHQHSSTSKHCRFDVIGVSPKRSTTNATSTIANDCQAFNFNWIPNAFCT